MGDYGGVFYGNCGHISGTENPPFYYNISNRIYIELFKLFNKKT